MEAVSRAAAQKSKALQVLTLSCAVRPADIEPRYRGGDRAHGNLLAGEKVKTDSCDMAESLDLM